MSNTHGGAYVVLPDGRTVTEAEAEIAEKLDYEIIIKPALAAVSKPKIKAPDDGN